MSADTNQSKQEENKDFGLPQAEFKPIEAEGGKWLRITSIIAGLVLIMGAGVVYWFFNRASSLDLAGKAHPTHESKENGVQKANVDVSDVGAPAQHQATARDAALAHPAKESEIVVGEAHIADVNASLHAVQPRRGGTVTSINTSQGHYYVVVGSFIDDDLAADYANRLAQQGVDVMLIAPPQGQYYFRVAVDQKNTFHDAHEKLGALKATYGDGIWVLKY